jgi:hypothetical protein
LSILIIRFEKIMSFVSTFLDLLKNPSSVFVILFGVTVYCKTPCTCVLSSRLLCFLHTIEHNVRNRLVGTNFIRPSETVSRYFNKVFHTIGELRNDFIRPPSSATPAKISGNHRWDPYFKVVA